MTDKAKAEDEAAWNEAYLESDRPHLNQCIQDLMDLGVDTNNTKTVHTRIHEIIENVFRVGHFRGFLAGRASKGEAWRRYSRGMERWAGCLALFCQYSCYRPACSR